MLAVAAMIAHADASADTHADASTRAARYAVVIGHDDGGAGEQRLRWAVDDARRFADVLARVGGFPPENIVVLAGDNDGPDDVRRALASINDRIRNAPGAGDGALLFVTYSGHADALSLHLGARALPLDDVEQLVRGSAASMRVLVVDACRSGSLTHVKGVHAVANDVAVAAPTSDGYVVLTAATAGEDAQESDAVQGSFFTHAFLSGLLGAADADGDLKVTLDEAYRYAFAETVRASSSTIAGTQHPTFRYDLRGKGDVVLATLDAASQSFLALPPDASFLVFEADSGRVVGEVSATAPRRALAVRPGRYFVRGRVPGALYEGDVDVGANETHALALADLAKTDYARLVRKGAADASLGLEAAFVGHTPLLNALPIPLGASVAAPVAFPAFTVEPRASLIGGLYENDLGGARYVEGDVEIALDHAFDFSFASLALGGFLGASLVHQDFDQGVRPLATHDTLGVSYGLEARVAHDIGGGFSVDGGVELRSGIYDTGSIAYVIATSESLAAPVVLGWRAGVVRSF